MAVENLGQIEAALTRLGAQINVATRLAVANAANIVEARAKANFEGAHAKGQPHVGGNKPNVVSGTLRRSIHNFGVRQTGVVEWSTAVAPSTVYARRIELGYPGGQGRGHQHTRPFPYFRPAVEQTVPEFAGIAADAWALFLH